MSARLRIQIRGAVQGVGFRPFVYRLASELRLHGRVRNDTRGVLVDVEGPRDALQAMLDRLPGEQPPLAVIHSLRHEWLEPCGYEKLIIEHSGRAGTKTVAMLPDAATCDDCRREMLESDDRRFRYPFINCTNCGPRFSIIEALPYDRPNTTMKRFVMCDDCRREYEDPSDRRFHAQPNACPACGPQLALLEANGHQIATRDEALQEAARAVRRGEILALKGLGGFHLIVDARSDDAVARLRERKHRPAKPLAVMARDLEQAAQLCLLDAPARQLLTSPQAPILLARRCPGAQLANGIAPGNPYVGIMLPYTPLHELLLRQLGFPIVATSGNLSDEPICIHDDEARRRLGQIADLFLVHDRPIARHVDDSIVRVRAGRPQTLRRARGRAPLPVLLSRPAPTILAVGAHLKNTIALCIGDEAFVSQHIGDMETPQAQAAFERVIDDFLQLYEARPAVIAHDLHPDYASTRWARRAIRSRLPDCDLIGVQHHHAHLASCLADRHVDSTALGVTWDGTGYGTDGTIWGGEFLVGDARKYQRIARLRPFRLPGGDAAIRRPARIGASLLWELFGQEALERDDLPPIAVLSSQERTLLPRMLDAGIRSPMTSSAGRLFDGVASLLGLHADVSFEGQAAMSLEFAADPEARGAYPMPLQRGDEPAFELDWRPLLTTLLEDLRAKIPVATIAARFHNGLAEAIVRVALEAGQERVALTGGCFQNELLSRSSALGLKEAGFEVLEHGQVPPNDGGISLGQVAVAAARRDDAHSQ